MLMTPSNTPKIDTLHECPNFWILVLRSLKRHCPRCGKAPLFHGYLKQVASCTICAHPWEQVRADDAPPWLTIFLVGHMVVPFALSAAKAENVPYWLSGLGLFALATTLVLLVLPFAKSLFIAIIWYVQAGSDQ